MEENNIDHADMVKVLAKSGEAIVEELTPEKAHLLHMAVGIAGEASGELLEALISSNNGIILDRKNIVEELGDIEFYVEGLCQGLGVVINSSDIFRTECTSIEDSAVRISVIASSGILDLVKKGVIYNKEVDIIKLSSHITDLKNEMAVLCTELVITHEEVIQGNIAKLGERYKGFKYSDKQAHDRADKQ